MSTEEAKAITNFLNLPDLDQALERKKIKKKTYYKIKNRMKTEHFKHMDPKFKEVLENVCDRFTQWIQPCIQFPEGLPNGFCFKKVWLSEKG